MTSSFDTNASTYDATAQVQSITGATLLEMMPDTVSGHLVDIGCGTGKLTLTLAQRWPDIHITGVDQSASMLAYATTHAAHPRIHYRHTDCESYTFSDTPNIIFSNAALQWLDAPIPYIQTLKRTYPQASFYISFFTRGTFYELRDAFQSLKKDVTLPAETFVTDDALAVLSSDFSYSFQELQQTFSSITDLFRHIRFTGTRGSGASPFITPGVMKQLETYFLDRFGCIKLTYRAVLLDSK